jgi:hypothetical protein
MLAVLLWLHVREKKLDTVSERVVKSPKISQLFTNTGDNPGKV